MHEVGDIIRSRRQALGLTLSALAGAIGVGKSYLSMIENKRVANPPSRGVLEKLERSLGLSDGALVRAAQWQHTPEPVKAALAQTQRDQQRGKALAQWLRAQMASRGGAGDGGGDGDDAGAVEGDAEAAGADAGVKGGLASAGAASLDALFASGQLRRMVDALLDESSDGEAGADADAVVRAAQDGVRGERDIELAQSLRVRVPIINRVAAGYPTDFTDLDFPARAADEYLDCPDIGDPAAFAARVVGRSMEPEYREGDLVVFSSLADVVDGCDCFVRLEPDHETTFKRIHFAGDEGELIQLTPLNRAFPTRTVHREQVAGLYRAMWRFQKLA